MRELRPFGGIALGILLSMVLSGCGRSEPSRHESAPEEPEPFVRTEFTDRIENFFEYEPLKVGKPSVFRIHLTDLSDGSPVAQAQVTLSAKGNSGAAVETIAKVGKVTGIYVAELTLPAVGSYAIEFHVKNSGIDERLPLTGFTVE